jgi:signal transduction histidine kinase
VRLELSRPADAQGVLAGLSSATRLALANSRLSAIGRAQLVDVQASQRRIVATSDGERRRIERDLHDGVQQRLVSVAFQLKVAMAHADPCVAEHLARAGQDVREALQQLRQLAHGIFPAVLSDEGLAPALEDLVAGAEVPASVDVTVPANPGLEAAMAAYAVVGAVLLAVEPAAGAAVHADVSGKGDQLTVHIALTGATVNARSGALGDAADRVGALGGRLTAGADGTHVKAAIPCVW